MSHRNTVLSVGLSLLAILATSCVAGSPYSDDEFRMPDIQWRPVPLWFWNNATVTGELTAEYGLKVSTALKSTTLTD